MDKIKVEKSGIHATGVFAAQDIPKGKVVIEYIGEKITKDESNRRLEASLEELPGSCGEGAVYIVDLDEEYDLDGDVPDNPAKYINHSCDPNCEMEIRDGRVFFRSLRDIKTGEELSFNYGYGIEDSETEEDLEDFKCNCGSPKCVGYMIDESDWPKLKELLAKKK